MEDIIHDIEAVFETTGDDDGEYELIEAEENRSTIRLSFFGDVPADDIHEQLNESLDVDVFGFSTTQETAETTDEIATVCEFRYRSGPGL